MSACGTKRTSGCAQSVSAFGGKADVALTGIRAARFWYDGHVAVLLLSYPFLSLPGLGLAGY